MEQSHTTEIKTTMVQTKWTIKGFSAIKVGHIMSPGFTGISAHTSRALTWRYKLAPRDSFMTTWWTSVKVIVGGPNCIGQSQIHADFEFEFNSAEIDNQVTSGIIEKQDKMIGTGIKVKRGLVEKHLLKHDVLTLFIKVSLHEVIVGEPQGFGKESSRDPQLLDHFASLLSMTKNFSDMTVIVGDEKFPVHRAILAVRSPVFAAMFEHTEMKESQQNAVIIQDIEPHVFQEVLRFIYTDTVQGLDRMAHELLAAADKYALDRLRTICEEILGKGLSVKTVTKTLHLADMHQAKNLRHQAIQFIAKNIKAMQPSDWKSLLANNPDVAAEMFSEHTNMLRQ